MIGSIIEYLFRFLNTTLLNNNPFNIKKVFYERTYVRSESESDIVTFIIKWHPVRIFDVLKSGSWIVLSPVDDSTGIALWWIACQSKWTTNLWIMNLWHSNWWKGFQFWKLNTTCSLNFALCLKQKNYKYILCACITCMSNWWANCLFSFSQGCSLLSGSLALEVLLLGVRCKKCYINV